MVDVLPPIERPNGKLYQPFKIVAHAWEDHDECKRGVVILGSNDPARVREFATEMCRYWYLGEYAVGGRPGWYRQGYCSGELRWLDDDVRGRAGVIFEASDDQPEVVSAALRGDKP